MIEIMKKVAVAIHAVKEFDINPISRLEELDYIHVDVMDGKFVNNTMLYLDVFTILRDNLAIPIIAHLMVTDPLEYVDRISDTVDAIFFHFEIEQDKHLIIEKIKKRGKKIGLVLNPPTKVSELMPYLPDIDYVLIMGVNPGWSGQKFIHETIEKVNKLARKKHLHNFEIDVDGGVNLENAKMLTNADILSSSSTILKAQDPNEVIQLLKASDSSEQKKE
ncbi:MAG: ribulose-phosphate 3-epimerase [Candidatus Lokiarchaeota archaeon]|nr:ribulose-phosphate 3-epimerase [Candidatus Lokiarchaeota archaeon]MBD3201327.1 ribulose-phosphate 3-epimerase [Candidatus Lokiarchaeota archaeon]